MACVCVLAAPFPLFSAVPFNSKWGKRLTWGSCGMSTERERESWSSSSQPAWELCEDKEAQNKVLGRPRRRRRESPAL